MKKNVTGNNVDAFIGREKGFTIVELLVAMTIGLIVMGSVYNMYRTQQKFYVLQEQVSAMQQNLRAGMTILTSDVRMAGYVHPTVSAAAGILTADPDKIKFSRLRDDLSLPLQEIEYNLASGNLVRSTGDLGGTLTTQLLAENIDALDFVYLDSVGNVIADPNSNLTLIKSVQVTMVARTRKPDQGYTDANSYSNQVDGADPILTAPGDSFHRRILSRQIMCRNL